MYLQWSALKKIYRVIAVIREVDRELGIYGVFVLILNALKHPSHLLHEFLILDEALTRDKLDRAGSSHLAQSALGIVIVLEKDLLEVLRYLGCNGSFSNS